MKRPAARAVLLAVLAIAAIGPTAVLANHQEVRVTVQVQHYNDVNVASYTTDAACDSTACVVTVPVNSRDAGRVLRWCGATTINLTVIANDTGASTECYGSSSWKVRVIAGLRLDDVNVASHPSDVGVEIHVVKG